MLRYFGGEKSSFITRYTSMHTNYDTSGIGTSITMKPHFPLKRA